MRFEPVLYISPCRFFVAGAALCEPASCSRINLNLRVVHISWQMQHLWLSYVYSHACALLCVLIYSYMCSLIPVLSFACSHKGRHLEYPDTPWDCHGQYAYIRVVPGGSGLIGSPSWQSQTGRVDPGRSFPVHPGGPGPDPSGWVMQR